MSLKMLINAQQPEELRVAVVEGGRLEAFYTETAAREQTRGNIYKGIVANVEPSLQAAFVDYGASRHGFLQASDIRPDLAGNRPASEKGPPPIQEVLKKGQGILVQVVKEETGNKGAALTTHLSIPGQYMVVTPGHEHLGVSRKIEDEAERKRIKETLTGMKRPQGLGAIARTAALGTPKKELAKNYNQLVRLWDDIRRRGDKARGPKLIHKEEELAVRTVRDLFTSDLKEILVDDERVAERVARFVSLVSPRRKGIVKLYREPRPIFAKHQLEEQIASIYQARVKLPGGGSLVINPTEALVTVDVNSGKAHAAGGIEGTALAVNLEAAAEIARQLRLRDLGGLVVIDFIDMRDRSAQRQVRKKLVDELKKDKAKTTVGHISRFGLLELSRQRIRPPIDFGATRVCPHCQGQGVLRTVEALGRVALRRLEERLRKADGGVRLVVPVEVAHYLLNVRRGELAEMEARAQCCVEVAADPLFWPEELELAESSQQWELPKPEVPEPLAALDELPPEPEVEEPEEEEAPKPKSRSRRSRGRRKKKPALDQGDSARGDSSQGSNGQAQVADGDGPEGSPEEGAAQGETKPKPKSRRSRSRRKKKPASDQGDSAQGDDAPEQAAEGQDQSAEGSAPKKKRRRRSGASRRKKAKAAAAETDGGESAANREAPPPPSEPQDY